jgi:hypothetical protein
MSLTGLKYGFPASFHRKHTFLLKAKAKPFEFLAETRYFLKHLKIYV